MPFANLMEIINHKADAEQAVDKQTRAPVEAPLDVEGETRTQPLVNLASLRERRTEPERDPVEEARQALKLRVQEKFGEGASTPARAESQHTAEPTTRPGVDLIKESEGLKLKGYYATDYEKEKGIVSVGYGQAGVVAEGEEISEEQAEELLIEEYDQIDSWIDKNIKFDLSDEQRGAVISLIYNVGVTQFSESKAIKALNRGDIDKFVTEAFDPKVGFVYQNKKVLKGLVNRRAKERELFLAGTERPEKASQA